MGGLGGSRYGEAGRTMTVQSERDRTIAPLESIRLDENHKLGVGTAVGAVAGTYDESKFKKKDAQRITVSMATGGSVTSTQPRDERLREGMQVRVEGSGESARVVPR